MPVTFCGHRNVENRESVRRWLLDTTERLLRQGQWIYYLGGYGEFDRMALSVLRQLKKTYPQIKTIYVQAYLDRFPIEGVYDDMVYPEIETAPLRYAIVRRNEKMVDMSDVVVAYVVRTWGGAYKTMRYAMRKHKTILQYSVPNAESAK